MKLWVIRSSGLSAVCLLATSLLAILQLSRKNENEFEIEIPMAEMSFFLSLN